MGTQTAHPGPFPGRPGLRGLPVRALPVPMPNQEWFLIIAAVG